MTVDPIVASVFSVVCGILFALIGWTMNRLFQRIDKLEDAHTRAEVELVKHFVTSVQLKELKDEIIVRLVRVDESLQHLSKRLERKAARGAPGQQGMQGERGHQGEAGEMGDVGKQGPPGKYLWIQKEGTEDAGGGVNRCGKRTRRGQSLSLRFELSRIPLQLTLPKLPDN